MTAAIRPFPITGKFRATTTATVLRGDLHARVRQRGNLLERLVEMYDIRAGDALVLEFVSKSDEADIGRISRGLGLKRRDVVDSVCRLIRAGLADAEFPTSTDSNGCRILPTHTGRLLAMRVMRL